MRPFPQRLFVPAPRGSLFKRAERSAEIMRDSGDDAYLTFIRACPCLHCGMEPCEAAHVRMASATHGKASGMGKKPEAKWCLPLCAEHHRLARDSQHNRGERLFWYALGINAPLACQRHYAKRGDLVAMQMTARLIIAERG